MLISGPNGFYNAPLTKCLFIIVLFFSLSIYVFKIEPTNLALSFFALRNSEWYRLFVSQFYFGSPSEFILGLALLYSWRIQERLIGTRKFAAHFIVVFIQITILNLAFLATIGYNKFVAPGPYGWIYSGFIFYLDIPPTIHFFKLRGISITDKIFLYMIGAQLFLIPKYASNFCIIAGIIAGITYRSNTLHIKEWEIPEFIINFCSKRILSFIQSQNNPTLMLINRNHPRRDVNDNQERNNRRNNRNREEEIPINLPQQVMPEIDQESLNYYYEISASMGHDRLFAQGILENYRNDVNQAVNFLLEQLSQQDENNNNNNNNLENEMN
ncbi:rhomboid protein [Anaeramoeba flamelloides]|uniref:Rhomboid protein n=1 Tax=Anaeramoeba flamelloides TaxID=1746091 RepID=A0AAV8A8C7_9EUKA|nr:rhomboid protein [Anaeramoeba flamelloides]